MYNNHKNNKNNKQQEYAGSGRLVGSFEELHKDGCIQVAPDMPVGDAIAFHGALFYGLMALTNDNPCSGCPVTKKRLPNKMGPLSIACTAFQNHHTAAQSAKATMKHAIEHATKVGTKNGNKYPGLPIREIAKREGVSIGEARRRKQAGEYD